MHNLQICLSKVLGTSLQSKSKEESDAESQILEQSNYRFLEILKIPREGVDIFFYPYVSCMLVKKSLKKVFSVYNCLSHVS